jgi:hypothetical protein
MAAARALEQLALLPRPAGRGRGGCARQSAAVGRKRSGTGGKRWRQTADGAAERLTDLRRSGWASSCGSKTARWFRDLREAVGPQGEQPLRRGRSDHCARYRLPRPTNLIGTPPLGPALACRMRPDFRNKGRTAFRWRNAHYFFRPSKKHRNRADYGSFGWRLGGPQNIPPRCMDRGEMT